MLNVLKAKTLRLGRLILENFSGLLLGDGKGEEMWVSRDVWS